MEERLMSANLYSEDCDEISLRPQTIEEYIGQRGECSKYN